jgi:hypothetical protein
MEPTSSVVSPQSLSPQALGLGNSVGSHSPQWLQSYQLGRSPYDEMWRQEGQIRAHWQPLV